ncbi:MAG: AAA family ATPase [Tannerellaceae bacterium]|nr:AAA family ATPase [Tannerellaceae bacterium]
MMDIKKVIIQDGNYICDIDISSDEWKQILQDEIFMSSIYKDTLIKFYSEPEHKSTCKALGEKHNQSPQSLNGTITAFAKAVQKRLNRFEIIGTNNEPTYWIIPMYGKYIGSYFEWTLRPELVQAMEELGMTEIKNEYQKFKTLLEYFVAHLEWLINNDEEGRGYSTYINPLIRDNLFCKTGKGYNGDKIQKQVEKWSVYKNGKLCINIQYNQSIGYKAKTNYINWEGTGLNIIAYWENNTVSSLVLVDYQWWHKPAKWIELKANKSPSELGLFDNNQPNETLKAFFGRFNEHIIQWNEEQENKQKMKEIEPYKKLLESNMNLILTGTPGTGKTYLAKQIALSMLFNKQDEKELNENEKQIMEDHYCFVQFHPSYDYTDFVEGLRAEKLNGQVIFNLHNGIFKSFCKKALISQGNMDVSVLYDDLAEQIENGDVETIKLKNGNLSQKLSITIHNGDCNIHWFDQKNAGESRNAVTKQRLLKLYKKFNSLDKLNSMTNINEEIRNVIKGCNASMYWAVLNYILNQSIESDNKPYIFVIDEINRGEISKIFGELFFSIDPGYRGIKGTIKTQYANIQSNDTIFDYRLGSGWFYVPENVYIIGTMNDIDRSVESMDFAMRRRFAWKEIKAIDRISMWDGNIDEWKEDAKKRMQALNEAIEKINGLGSAYHIGSAYFLKLKNYDGDFDTLWENHLQGVLSEYLRGFPDIEDELSNLKNAYNLL